MKYRIEVGKARSTNWAWALRLMKQFSSYKVMTEDGLEVHAIEFGSDQKATALAVWDIVRGWKQVAVYVEGKLKPNSAIWDLYHEVAVERAAKREAEWDRKRIVARGIEEANRKKRDDDGGGPRVHIDIRRS